MVDRSNALESYSISIRDARGTHAYIGYGMVIKGLLGWETGAGNRVVHRGPGHTSIRHGEEQ